MEQSSMGILLQKKVQPGLHFLQGINQQFAL
jgi:hypothetical protein